MKTRQIFFFTLGPLGSAAISFLTLPVMTWIFPVEDIGRFAILQIAITLSFVFFGFALDQIFVREFYEYKDKDVLLKTLMTPGLFLFIFFGLFFYIFDVNASEILFGDVVELNDFMLFLIFFCCFIINFLSINMRMSGNSESYCLITIFPKLCLFLFVILNCFFMDKSNFSYIFISLFFSYLLCFCLSIFLCRKEYVGFFKCQLDKFFLRSSIKLSIPLFVATGAYWGITGSDKFLLRYLSSFEEVGIYSVAMSFAGVAVLIQGLFSTLWTPIFYKWSSEGLDEKKLSKIVEKLLAVFVIAYCFIGGGAWLAAYIVPEDYFLIKYILPSCVGGPLLYMLSETTVVGIYLKRKYHLSMIAAFVSFLLAFGLNYILIPFFGAAGASVATSFGFLSLLVLRTEFSSKFIKVFPKKKIYFFSGLCVFLSAMQSLLYEEYFFKIWIIFLFFALFFFRKPLFLLVSEFLMKKKV